MVNAIDFFSIYGRYKCVQTVMEWGCYTLKGLHMQIIPINYKTKVIHQIQTNNWLKNIEFLYFFHF